MRTTPQILKLCLITVVIAFSASACNRNHSVEAARSARQQPASPAEQDFMFRAAQMNLAEIDLAQLASQKSEESEVTGFASMIRSAHTTALEDLTDLMRDKGLSLPGALSPEAKADIEKMSALSGPEMNREFVNMMVADHQKAIEMFRDEVNSAQSPDVKKYAGDLLPRLEMHLEKAQKLQSKLFGGGKP